jgi:hypothetical protein
MKKFYLILVVFFSFFHVQLFAKTWRVNNIPGVAADFTTMTEAHNAANPGDTIHLEPSPYPYTSFTCTKKLFLVGAGYFLEENLNTQSQNHTSVLQGITFNAGAEGSVVSGIDFYGSDINIYCNDIVIRRNKFARPGSGEADDLTGTIHCHYRSDNSSIPVTNILISQNYGVNIDVNYSSTGILINNNYIAIHARNGETTQSACLVAHANAVLLVQNNIFRRGKITTNNSSFTNNIMVAGFVEGTGNAYSNNLANGTQFGTANNNKANINMATVFVGTGTGISTDAQWKLKTGSPAIGAGYGSTSQNPIDAGVYGGATAYVLAGQTHMPAIYFFEVQAVGSSTDPVDVSVKVKSAGN